MARPNVDWLTILKTALDIYHDEIRGYSGVPFSKEDREEVLKPGMIDLVDEAVSTILKGTDANDSTPICDEDIGYDA